MRAKQKTSLVALFATSGLNRNDLKIYLHFNIFFSFDSQENIEIRKENERRYMIYLLRVTKDIGDSHRTAKNLLVLNLKNLAMMQVSFSLREHRHNNSL